MRHHTGEPWQLKTVTGAIQGTAAIMGHRGGNPASMIATVYRTNESDGTANAWLMLHAPVLLDLCQRALAVLESDQDEDPPDDLLPDLQDTLEDYERWVAGVETRTLPK